MRQVELELKNTGSTPALDVAVTMMGLGANPAEPPGLSAQSNPRRTVISAGAADDAMFVDVPADVGKLFVLHGIIEYRDIFREPEAIHRTEFCAYYPTPRPPFMFNCPTGNEMN